MSLSDWNEYLDTTAMMTQTSVVDTGSYSYEIGDPNNQIDAAFINNKSENDNPAEGKISSRVYLASDDRHHPLFIFRFQDADNWYGLHWGSSNNNLRLGGKDGGSSFNGPEAAGSLTEDTWVDITLKFWIGPGDDLFLRLLENGTQIQEMEDEANRFSSGGGIGIGSNVGSHLGSSGFSNGNTATSYYDETEIFY